MSKRKFDTTFSAMQAGFENIMQFDCYFSLLLCADEMMFEYDGLPETIDSKHIEDYLNISGTCGFGKIGDKLFAAPYCSRCGELDQYGVGKELVAYVPNGQDIRGVVGDTVAIMYNNTAWTAQTDLIFDTITFADIAKSSKSNVLFARVAPIFAAANDTMQRALKDVLQNIIEGNLETVVSENVFDGLMIDNSDKLKSIDITHPERIQYLQYLSEYYDVVLRRHFARRGLTLKTSSKHAQVSQDEVHGLDSVSWYYPLSKLKARQEGCKMVNDVFGTNISVRFSDLWQQEYEAYKLRALQQDTEAEQETEQTEREVESNDSGTENENA